MDCQIKDLVIHPFTHLTATEGIVESACVFMSALYMVRIKISKCNGLKLKSHILDIEGRTDRCTNERTSQTLYSCMGHKIQNIMKKEI